METRTVTITYADGFYEPENDGLRDFRWMCCAAACRLTAEGAALALWLGNPHPVAVELRIVGQKTHCRLLEPGWQELVIPLSLLALDAEGNCRLLCERKLQPANDSRELALMVGACRCVPLPEVLPLAGFYAPESEALTEFSADFCWMQPEARLLVCPGGMTARTASEEPSEPCAEQPWFLLDVRSPSDWPEKLFVSPAQHPEQRHMLHVLPGEWQVVGLPLAELLPPGTSCAECGPLELVLSTPYELNDSGDTRHLALRVSNWRCKTPSRYERNAALMHREVFQTATPTSIPTMVACDTSAQCNLRCAFCCLDMELRPQQKGALGLEKTGVITRTLLETASKIQPYLTGEPFAREDIWTVLEQAARIARQRRIEVEVSTNGLLLRGALLERVLASSITSLLITVNAATPATYKRLCGGNWQQLTDNLNALCRHSRRKKSLAISLSYVLMRENMEEVADFVEFAHSVGADKVQIWPLNNVTSRVEDKILKDGFVFCYRQQEPQYYPNLTRKMLALAQERGARLGVNIGIVPCYRFDMPDLEDIPYPLPPDVFAAQAAVFDQRERERESFGRFNAAIFRGETSITRRKVDGRHVFT